MAFFNVTLNARDGTRSLRVIFESRVSCLSELMPSARSHGSCLFLAETEWRSVRDDSGTRWLKNPTAIALNAIVKINEIVPPVGADGAQAHPAQAVAAEA
jgi:hypothetical protein